MTAPGLIIFLVPQGLRSSGYEPSPGKGHPDLLTGPQLAARHRSPPELWPAVWWLCRRVGHRSRSLALIAFVLLLEHLHDLGAVFRHKYSYPLLGLLLIGFSVHRTVYRVEFVNDS